MNDIITCTANYFEALLNAYRIKHKRQRLYDGYQWFFDFHGDIVIHGYSYNYAHGYLESMGFSWDNDNVSVFTPHEMIEHLIEEEKEKIKKS